MRQPLYMQYSLCHQLKQLNRVFKGEQRRDGGEETAIEEGSSHGQHAASQHGSAPDSFLNERGSEDKG